MLYSKKEISNDSFNDLSKEFFDSFDISPRIICSNEELLGMQYECNKGEILNCNRCKHHRKIYPVITEELLLKLVLVMLTEIGFNSYIKQDVNALADYTLKTLIVYKKKVKDEIQEIFKLNT